MQPQAGRPEEKNHEIYVGSGRAPGNKITSRRPRRQNEVHILSGSEDIIMGSGLSIERHLVDSDPFLHVILRLSRHVGEAGFLPFATLEDLQVLTNSFPIGTCGVRGTLILCRLI